MKLRISFALLWTGSLISVSSNVFNSQQDVNNFFELVEQELFSQRQKEYRVSRSGPMSTIEEGTSISRDTALQTLVYIWQQYQEPFEIIADLAQRSYGNFDLDEILKEISGTAQFQPYLQRCLSAVPQISCDANSTYRTFDGTCNNLKNPRWGSVLSCNERILNASYEGQTGYRKSVKFNKELPGPRIMSTKVFGSIIYNRTAEYVNNMFIFFGQMLAHDITNVATSTANGEVLECCPPREDAPAQCAPIRINLDDPFYSSRNVTCLNFVRNAPCPTCSFDKRIQMNQVTSYIDCSFIYGTNNNSSRRIRKLDGTGKLRMRYTDVGELLTSSARIDPNRCGLSSRREFCFRLGDGRVNQQTPLMSAYTIFAREHNRIAEKLGNINPDWDDEIIFQETRKILIGVMQNIVYNEYLPALLGEDQMTRYDLWINDNHPTRYDANVNPAMLTEFNSAAFRLHPLCPSRVLNGPDLRNLYSFATPLYQGRLNEIVESLMDIPAQKYGPYLSDDVRNFLYRPLRNDSGMDLPAINLHRGRDHGLPPYCEVLENFVDMKKVETFDDLTPYICTEYIELLKTYYEDVRDIDLWTGLLMECPKNNGILGRTASLITAEQFKRLRVGDRYFYDIKNTAASFTDLQLNEIKKATLAGVICESTDIKEVNIKALLLPSLRNPVLPCFTIPKINLDFWRSF